MRGGQLAGGLEAPTRNHAFVFIKPHAQTPGVKELVEKKLADSKVKVLRQGLIEGEDIDEKRLIDQHYYAIASKATLLTPDELPVPEQEFSKKFGEDWTSVLADDRAANAMQACERFGITADELEAEWRQCEERGLVIKFGGGFYCGKMTVNDKDLYVFNAFFMAMRSKFTAPGTSIYYYSVSWDPAVLPWTEFRGTLLGPTDPGQAPLGSIRNTIFCQWKELGLRSEPNKGDNGVHASASPFEGLAEEMNWLQTPLADHPFGKALLAAGVDEKQLKAWSLDPQVQLCDGKRGSIFDALEDQDAADCFASLVALASLKDR
jgi:hypothetical protein